MVSRGLKERRAPQLQREYGNEAGRGDRSQDLVQPHQLPHEQPVQQREQHHIAQQQERALAVLGMDRKQRDIKVDRKDHKGDEQGAQVSLHARKGARLSFPMRTRTAEHGAEINVLHRLLPAHSAAPARKSVCTADL